VANALLRGETGTQSFTDEKVNDPDIRGMMQKITVVLDPAKTALEASVEIATTDGKRYSGFSDILQQIPPLANKKDRVRKKFFDLCGTVFNEKKVEQTAEKIYNLEKIENMKDFIEGL
jgi:2-methylcitrate dehydratase PrpD